MKIFGGMYLWTIVVVMFFKRFSAGANGSSYRRDARMPDAEIIGHDEPTLTYTEVERAFRRAEAPTDPTADHRTQT